MLERLPLLAAPVEAAEPGPCALGHALPEQVPWGPVGGNGNRRAVPTGDAAMVTWLPGHRPRLHLQADGRFMTALSGTSTPAGTP